MAQQAEWGCHKNSALPLTFDGEDVWRCPRLPLKEDPDNIGQVLWYYSLYRKGNLPEAGGLMDQPGLLMDMFRVIDNAVADVEAHKQEEREQQAKKSQWNGGRRGAVNPATVRRRPKPPKR